MNNVSIITGKNMCCSCASCAEVCPKGAITYQLSKGIYSPVIDEQKCVDCGICLKVCPAAIEGKTPVRLKSDMFDWKEKECYIAHCKDEVVRHRSKSGGIVTTMVTKLLNDGVYERAYLLEYEGTEGKASLSIFKKGDDIKRTANSKYIPVSIDKVIAAIKNNVIEKSIVVGTPCHMRAIKAALQLYKRSEEDVLLIGLFCNKVFTYDVFRYYDKYYGPFEKFHFCDKESGGWPGGSWYVKDGHSGTIPRKERMALRDYYSLNKCRFCGNQMNNQADISLGDCYVKGKDSPLGNSSVVIRTEKGHWAFDYCKDDFVLEHISFQQIKSSQTLFEKVPNVIRPKNEPYTKEVIMAEDVSDRGLEAIHKEVEKRKNEYNNTMSKKIKGRLKNYFKKSKTPVFLIRSGGFLNKGSDMMRRITINQIRLFYPNAIIAVTHYVWNENPEECKREGLVMMIGGLRYEKIKKIVPEFILRKKYVTPKMVDVVLDVSGFTYGDAWASKSGDLETERLFWSHFTKPNRKVILLPQAFGPFNNEWSKKTMEVAYNASSIIYARENVSMDILKKMFPGDNKILLAPDFTANLNANSKMPVVLNLKAYCLVVPNQRMVDRTKADVGNSYKQYMIKVVKFLISKGENVVLFNHEGKGDELLMYEINKEFDNKLMTVTGLDGLETKTFIGNAKLLISSRFHGVVSGLCQQVPTFCTSWNHKYEELLKDYRCEGNILDVNDITKTETIIADALENPDKYISPKEAIEDIKNRAQQMWCDVFYYIKNGSMKNL